jgi:hypothetical protein
MSRSRDRRIARRDDAPEAAERPKPAIPADATPREVAAMVRAAGGARVGLMRSLGNQLAREVAAVLHEDALPPAADNLRRYRDGVPRLRSLASQQPPGADWATAVRWLTEVTTTLRQVAPIADGSMLVFESQVVPGHDAEYGTASSEIRQLVREVLGKLVPVVRDIVRSSPTTRPRSGS